VHAVREIKIVFAGPMGAGKTTDIRALSDQAPVSTEVTNEILCKGSPGVILLVDGRSATALTDLEMYLEMLRGQCPKQPLVIGVGRLPVDAGQELDRLAASLAARDIAAPVFGVDVRSREDILLLVETLLCILEMRASESLDGVH